MKIVSLFSGIGPLELGLVQAGLGEVVLQVEIDPYCRAVLRKNFPGVPQLADVRAVTRDAVDGDIDLICGGFPCQPVSVAGARRGQSDPRWLWPEYARIIRELQPRWVVIENVPGLRTLGLHGVLQDLAALGFDAEWTRLSAADVGAPHLRRRLFLVAAHSERCVVRLEPGWLSRACRAGALLLAGDGAEGTASDAGSEGREGPAHGAHEGRQGSLRDAGSLETDSVTASDADEARELQSRGSFGGKRGWARDAGWREPPPAVRGVDDGAADGLDARASDAGGGSSEAAAGEEEARHGREAEAVADVEAPDAWRIGALGNAVVWQCAFVVGCAIRQQIEQHEQRDSDG